MELNTSSSWVPDPNRAIWQNIQVAITVDLTVLHRWITRLNNVKVSLRCITKFTYFSMTRVLSRILDECNDTTAMKKWTTKQWKGCIQVDTVSNPPRVVVWKQPIKSCQNDAYSGNHIINENTTSGWWTRNRYDKKDNFKCKRWPQ